MKLSWFRFSRILSDRDFGDWEAVGMELAKGVKSGIFRLCRVTRHSTDQGEERDSLGTHVVWERRQNLAGIASGREQAEAWQIVKVLVDFQN